MTPSAKTVLTLALLVTASVVISACHFDGHVPPGHVKQIFSEPPGHAKKR